MSGDRARLGFTYQDRYLIKRVLDDIAVEVKDGNATGVIFGLESLAQTAATEDGPKWDVVVSNATDEEVIEVKSGVVTAEERRTFWRRLRREFNRGKGSHLIPKLVCDPAKIGGLNHFRGLAEAAERLASHDSKPFKGYVTSVETLCAEAIDGLCNADLPDGAALGFEQARKLLQHFQIELEPADDLKRRVDQGIELFLPNGFTDSTRQLIHGWLIEKASDTDLAARKFRSRELIAIVKTHHTCLNLESGELQTWKRLWIELPGEFGQRAQKRLGKSGPTIGVLDGQPLIGPALLALKTGGTLALGKGGGGKSGLARQIAEELAARDPEGVLVMSADDLVSNQVKTFCDSIRFKTGLKRFKNPDSTFTLIVDGLDEAEPGLREVWVKALARLAQQNGLSVLVTMREGVWQSDNQTQKHLEKFQKLAVADWPVSLVLSYLSGPSPQVKDFPNLLTLLCQPLMLDLFWRTFVEEVDSPSSGGIPATRHQLLSRFWARRIAQSARHRNALTSNRLERILSAAATSLEPFEVNDGETPGVDALLSESVLVQDGRIVSRLRFRHVLLRDFSLSLWCLQAKSPSEAISRWKSIIGGLRRNGALRAMLDAISDPTFGTDFPHLPLADLLAALTASEEGQSQLAQVLATMLYRPELDPNFWPTSVQNGLLSSFGRKLVNFAETHQNTSWAQGVRNWQATLNWLDAEFGRALFSYAERASRICQQSNDLQQRGEAKLLAAKLREVTELPEFESVFTDEKRHLKMSTIKVVVAQLPDLDSLEWVEREMTIASWFTRSWTLEILIDLAGVNVARAAKLYREAVGLELKDGRWQLSFDINDRAQEHLTLDGSLGAIHGGRSLLLEHPKDFAPIAVQMAEAVNEADAPVMDGIIDEAWMFWGLNGHASCHQYVSVLKKKGQELADSKPALFLSAVAPALISSRLLSVHSALLDTLLMYSAKPGFTARLVEALKDPRYYHFRTIGHWMQRALQTCWPALSAADKETVLQNLAGTEAAIENGREHAGRLASVVPEDELTDQLKELAAEQRGKAGCVYAFFGEREHIYEVPVPFEEAYAYFYEGWSSAWSREHLTVLARSSEDINRQNISVDDLRLALSRIGNSITALLPVIETNREEFFSADQYKLLERIEQWLQRHAHRREIVPSPDVIARLAALTMTELEEAEYLVGEHVHDLSVIAKSESSWSRALSLMALLFTFLPARADETLRQRFMNVVRSALTNGDKFVQALVAHNVTSTHWKSTSERTALYEELFWTTERDPLVTSATLQTLMFMPDDLRERALRIAYNRSPEEPLKGYAERLGKALGLASFFPTEGTTRTRVVKLTEEIIRNPTNFPFLLPQSVRQECLREMAFGMSEQFGPLWSLPNFAHDYSRWMLGIWRLLRPLRHPGHQSEGVVSSVFFQLQNAHAAANDATSQEKLKGLWLALRPFAIAIANEGGRPDLFYLFFALRGAEFASVIPNDDLFELVQIVVNRLAPDVTSGLVDLKARDPEHEDFSAWCEVLRHAAGTLDALIKNNLLLSDPDRERCHALLASLASEPFNIDSAVSALSRLQKWGV